MTPITRSDHPSLNTRGATMRKPKPMPKGKKCPKCGMPMSKCKCGMKMGKGGY